MPGSPTSSATAASPCTGRTSAANLDTNRRSTAPSDALRIVAPVLAFLRVDNLVLIRSAELELAPGMTVIAGETGAGKTILARAVGLLLGSKADAALVGPGGREAYVEAGFEGV